MTDKVVEMVDSVGLLGSGAVAQAIARRCAAVGIPVLLSNSRGPDSLAELVASLGPQTRAATVQEAAQADLVVLAVPFVKVPDVAAEIGDWAGRTVVDATNQFAEHQPNYAGRADLGDQTGSEWVAGYLPGAVLVKAFNAMFASFIAPDPATATAARWCSTPVTTRTRTPSSPALPKSSVSRRCWSAAYATAAA